MLCSFQLLLLFAAAAAAGCFSRVRLCATPETAAHQAPPSLGFSRQEHWSGLPFPSPMYEREKWKWCLSVSRVRLFVTPWTAAHQAPPSMGFSRQEYWSGLPFSSPYYYLRSREREQKLKEDVGNKKGYIKIHLNTEGDGCAGKKNWWCSIEERVARGMFLSGLERIVSSIQVMFSLLVIQRFYPIQYTRDGGKQNTWGHWM